MKNLTFISIKQVLVCCISILLLSCSSDAKYSCNPEVEKWARTNIDKYVTATRSEIVELSMEQQRAILRGLPADKEANLWREKLAYIMQDSKLSEEEKQEVKSIYDYFIPYFYSQDGLEEAEEYEKEWINHMQTTYNWDNDMIYYYVCTWLIAEEYEKVLLQESLKTLRVSTRSEADAPDCECRYDSECHNDRDCNIKANCKITGKCGIGGQWSCDGLCNG
ncbi:bacteriocin fulvocin C-related protein [Alistipes finegoldii]|uniref:bacteriocin fulvocin C-related protein n=1 Tax=Alistipes finegoldii TaxID=214856 RepID=UPI00242E2B72|nr:bacteriocin fulvocin C-related protein [Alistipes finegoldii]